MAGHHPLAILEVQGLRWKLLQAISVVFAVFVVFVVFFVVAAAAAAAVAAAAAAAAAFVVAFAVCAAEKIAAGLGEELGSVEMWKRETETHPGAVVPCPVAPEESFDWGLRPPDYTSKHCAL